MNNKYKPQPREDSRDYNLILRISITPEWTPVTLPPFDIKIHSLATNIHKHIKYRKLSQSLITLNIKRSNAFVALQINERPTQIAIVWPFYYYFITPEEIGYN